MPLPHLPSRFLTTGLLLALLLTVLAWGFRQAPDAARQTLPQRLESLHVNPLLSANCTQRRLPPPEKFTLPIYPGCEGEADYEDRVFCGFGRLAEFIQDNKVEPEGSPRERVILSFVIDKDSGLMSDVRAVKGQDERNIKEAKRIVQLMIDRQVRWTPATSLGKPISLNMKLPIPFHGAGCGE